MRLSTRPGLLLLAVALFLYGAYGWWQDRPVSTGPGVIAPASPVQETLADAKPFPHGEFRLTPRARFEVEARVLGRETYRFDEGADLAPVDLALGWGPMSDATVLEYLTIRQSGRFYRWRAEQLPIPRREIERNSANMHLIPSRDGIHDRLAALRPGQVVRFSGYLVDAERADGWRWRTSLTRDDTGNGACELVWVEDLAIR